MVKKVILLLLLKVVCFSLSAQREPGFEAARGIYASLEPGISIFQPDDSEISYGGKRSTGSFRLGLGYQTQSIGISMSWRSTRFPFAEEEFVPGLSSNLVSNVFGLDTEGYFGRKNQLHIVFGLLAGRHTISSKTEFLGKTSIAKEVTRSKNGLRIALGYARLLNPDLRLVFDFGVDGTGIHNDHGFITYDAGYFNFTLGAQYNFLHLF